MNKAIGLLAIVALVAVPAAAQKVSVDWDRDANFESFKSFAWVDGPPTRLEGNHPMVHSLIKNSIEYWMTSGGMVEDTENPDLNVTYHTGGKESYQFMTTAYGYSYPVGWGYMGGTYTGSTMMTTYDEGTLVIDIWNAETKKAVFGEKSQASHLTYIGDASLGKNVNVGCGTITCNYDGVNKHQTTIGDDVFVGSDTQFVAPVTIGRGSFIGAGSTITKDVPEDALAITRAEQKNIAGWAIRNRQKLQKQKK